MPEFGIAVTMTHRMANPQFFAVVPAAGRSERMGQPKLLMRLGGSRLIEHVLAALAAPKCVREIVVVLRPDADELTSVVQATGATALRLPQPTGDMRASIEFGLDYLESRYRPAPDDGLFVTPADHPSIPASLLEAQVAAFVAGQSPIIVPRAGIRRGHPLLMAWRHTASLRALPPALGLNALLQSPPAPLIEIVTPRDDAAYDIDTPADLERYRQTDRSRQ
jgi:molybdenum cofactor cytidylyltransferase